MNRLTIIITFVLAGFVSCKHHSHRCPEAKTKAQPCKKANSKPINNKKKQSEINKSSAAKQWLKKVQGPSFEYKPATKGQNAVVYQKRQKDKVLEEIKAKRKELAQNKNNKIEAFIKEQKEKKKLKRENKKRLYSDLSTLDFPQKLEVFNKITHLPPVPQYYTGTCWSFATTSFFESEIFRLTKKKIKLSEMWSAYWEYVEKARRFIRMKGYSYVAQGDEPNALLNVYKKYGVVPHSVYKGIVPPRKKHDHTPMVKELKSFLKYIKDHNMWDEKANLAMVKGILNRHLGEPPTKFNFQGKEYTPKSFLKNVTRLNPVDYVVTMSTLAMPYYKKGLLDVPDNWWRSEEYINLPLKVWTSLVKKGVKGGYSFVIGGDVSEPGKVPEKDIFFVPTFDLPTSLINSHSREFRINNHTTTDDHGVHLTGYYQNKNGGEFWYLIKDSGRSSRYGNYKGYYFMNEYYLKLKILTWMAHKDVIKSVMNKIKK